MDLETISPHTTTCARCQPMSSTCQTHMWCYNLEEQVTHWHDDNNNDSVKLDVEEVHTNTILVMSTIYLLHKHAKDVKQKNK